MPHHALDIFIPPLYFDQGTHCLGLQLWPLPCHRLHLCNDPGQPHPHQCWTTWSYDLSSNQNVILIIVKVGKLTQSFQVGLRVREWKKVMKEATKGFEFERMTTTTTQKRGKEGKREEEMVADVARLERGLSLRSAEEK